MSTYPGRVRYQPYGWTRRHPTAADSLLGALLLASSAGQLRFSANLATVSGIAINTALAACVALRRRETAPAFIVAAVIGLSQAVYGFGKSPIRSMQPTVTDVAIVVLLYTLAAYRPRRESVPGLLACLIGAGIAISGWSFGQRSVTLLLLGSAALGATFITAWVLGDSMAYRRAYYASLEERVAAAERARDLEGKRARAVEDAAARLRRIERDLHDGAQVRLAALAMTLGEVKETMLADPEGALDLVGSAHRADKDTLSELRRLARGIHPAALDRGLAAALRSLADTSAVPVSLDVDLTGRPSPAIETIVYYSAAELLANAAKHSGANRSRITVRQGGRGILLTVTDNGRGGAELTASGGLAGLRDRARTVDGQLAIYSPQGGPTTVTIDLPEHA